MSVHPRKDWKAVQLPYEKIASYSGAKKRRYELSDRTVAMLLAQTSYLHWASRWQSDTPLTEAQKRQIRQWAAQAEAELFPKCISQGCVDYTPDDPMFEFAPMNPYTQPGLVTDGYAAPAFRIVTSADTTLLEAGFQLGDVYATAPPIVAGIDFPRFRVTFQAPCEIEIHLLTHPLGGNFLMVTDGNPLTAKVGDLYKDISSIPPESIVEVTIEEVFTDNLEHFIDVTYVPTVDTEIPPVLFGGGLRKVTICSETDCPEIVEMFDVRQNEENPCTLEKTDDGGETWTAWANLHLCPPLLRQGEDGELEYSPDGGETWEDVPREVDDPLYTNPPAPLGDNGACDRASNAMRVYSYFAQTLANIIDDTPGGILPLIAAQYARLFYDFFTAAFAGQLDAASSATALNQEILNYLTALFLDATAAGQSAGTYLRESWDGFTQEDVFCAFYCTANPDGTLNYSAAQARLLELVNVDDIRPTVKALIDCFGEGGFAAAQSVEGTTDRDCDECECDSVWCWEWDFTVDSGGWQANPRDGGWGATWTAGVGWTRPNTFCISRQLPLNVNIYQAQIFFSSGSPLRLYWEDAFPNAVGGDTIQSFPFASSPGGLPGGTDIDTDVGRWISIQADNYTQPVTVTRVRLEGFRENPFGEDNCD